MPNPITHTTYTPNTRQLLLHKESWGVIISSAAIDPIWWLFVFWIPIYLSEVYGMDVKSIGIYGWVPYVGAMIGAWFGGLLAQNRMKAGWNVSKTRKFVIVLGCLIMLPALLAMANPGSAFTLVGFAVLALGNDGGGPAPYSCRISLDVILGGAGGRGAALVCGVGAMINWTGNHPWPCPYRPKSHPLVSWGDKMPI